jgi:hypothetical protein
MSNNKEILVVDITWYRDTLFGKKKIKTITSTFYTESEINLYATGKCVTYKATSYTWKRKFIV